MKITALAKKIMGNSLYDYYFFRWHHCRMLRLHGFPATKAEGEKAYLAQWKAISPRVSPYDYRLYSHFCGPTADIVPFDLLRNVIEPVINPLAFWATYEDKNMFATIVGEECLPRTVASRIAGGPVKYRSALGEEQVPLILKPSVGTSCGDGIMRFDRTDGGYRSSDGTMLDDRFLNAYGNDFILQEAVEQHPVLRRLSPTAVATIRLVVYRSVADNLPHATAAVLRVGATGSVVDNIVAGGKYLGLDMDTGRINTPFIAFDGLRSAVWNGIDIETETELTIPAWKAVKELGLRVATCIPHHRLLALDIAITPTEKPMLIEYNIGSFSSYLFHYTGQTVFGPYTDEVIELVRAQR